MTVKFKFKVGDRVLLHCGCSGVITKVNDGEDYDPLEHSQYDTDVTVMRCSYDGKDPVKAKLDDKDLKEDVMVELVSRVEG